MPKKILIESEENQDDERDYFWIVDSLYKTHLELLRQTILICLLSQITADKFSETMRTGKFEGIPKNIKSYVPEQTYLDDTIKMRINHTSKKQ